MSGVRFSERRIEALGPRKSPYDIRDADLKGFGVRVLPSGRKRFFIHSRREGRRRRGLRPLRAQLEAPDHDGEA